LLTQKKNPVGIALGTVLPTLFVDPDNKSDLENYSGFKNLLLLTSIISTLIAVFTFIFFEDGAVESTPKPPKYSLSLQLKSCLSNRDFIYLLLAFGIGLGLFNTVTTLIEKIAKKAFYSADESSIFGALLIVFGLIGAGIAGMILDTYHCYNALAKTGFTLCFGIISILCLSLRPDHVYLMSGIFATLGFCALPLMPICLECALECTYPVKEEISNGLLMGSGQLVGMLMTAIVTKLLDSQENYGDHYIFEPLYTFTIITVAISVLFGYLYQGPYLRLLSERLELHFSEEFVHDILQGKKCATTRFLTEASDIQVGNIVSATILQGQVFTKLCILDIQLFTFKSLDDRLAKLENVSSAEELRQILLRFYPDLQDDDVLTVFFFSTNCLPPM